MSTDLDAAGDEFVRAIADALAKVRAHQFFAEGENQAAGYAFFASMLVARIEEEIVFDPDFPYLRVLDSRIREGGDNPDQRYLISRLRGGETYRIWGTRGGARRVDVQIYAGDPYVPGSGGRAASFLTFEQMTFAADGSFEIIASPERRAGNWIENPPDATRVLVRQVYSDWDGESGGEVHIDRVGHEGDPKPVLGDADMAARLRAAAASLVTHVQVWPDMVANGYLAHTPPNQVAPPFDPGTRGGVPGRWMCHGWWDLADDEALVVTTWPASGNYQGIQLADLWFSSLEYANRPTCLTADQAEANADGSFTFVIAGHDPGVPNWLDTTGRRRGVILLRYDGTTDAGFDPAHEPRTVKTTLAGLAAHLPAGTRTVDAGERAATLAARRRHVQQRYGF